MTDPLDLTEIEARRDVAYADGSWDEREWRDIIALLAEVKRLQPMQDGEHHYLSTYCLHGLHDRCRWCCKVCESPCRCDCHKAEAGGT